MVLADLGRKITTALRSLSSATVINEEVSVSLGCPWFLAGGIRGCKVQVLYCAMQDVRLKK